MTSNWHKLKQAGIDSGEKTMLLVASFNHWFPIKMDKVENIAPNKAREVDDGQESLSSAEHEDGGTPSGEHSASASNKNKSSAYLRRQSRRMGSSLRA